MQDGKSDSDLGFEGASFHEAVKGGFAKPPNAATYEKVSDSAEDHGEARSSFHEEAGRVVKKD